MDWALAVPAAQRDWEFAGFLDDRPAALEGYSCRFPIFGTPEGYQFTGRDRFVCAIGDARTRLRFCRGLNARRARFISLIHPSAIVGSNSEVGEGCILCPNSIITNNVRIGSFVILNAYSSVGHDAVLGDGCTLSGHADVTGGVVLGEGVFMGSHASILPRTKVGDYAVIGAGSVALKKVKSGTTVFGVPAIEM